MPQNHAETMIHTTNHSVESGGFGGRKRTLPRRGGREKHRASGLATIHFCLTRTHQNNPQLAMQHISQRAGKGTGLDGIRAISSTIVELETEKLAAQQVPQLMRAETCRRIWIIRYISMSFSKIFVAFVLAEINQASLRYTGVSCIHNQ